MRGLASVALTAWLLVLAAPALGDDHLMRVNELKLSTGGDQTAQWVELIDSSNEGGPSPTYKLRFFDSAGAFVAEQELPGIFDGEDTAPYLVAHDNAMLDASRDAELTITMPAGAGQVCFTRGGTDARIHCIAYGCPAAALTSEGGTLIGKAPTDLESLQRLDTSLFLGSPTPNATNTATTSAACPTSGNGGGNGGGGGTGGGGGSGGGGGGTGGGTVVADTASPIQTLSFRRIQDVDRLAVAVQLNEAAAVAVGGSVNVPARARVYRFRTVRRNLVGGIRTTVRLRLPRAGLRAAKRYLRRRGRRLTARVRIDARDQAGNPSSRRLSIRLRD